MTSAILPPVGGDQFPIFDQFGKMMGNQTSLQGLPTIPAFPTPNFGDVFSSFPSTLSKTAPSVSTGIPGTTPASNVPAGATTGNVSAPASGAEPASVWDNYLARGAVVVLGFIFVAVGLAMFASGGTVIQAVRKVTPGA